MAKGPVQVVLNSESYITLIPQQRTPMGNKDFTQIIMSYF